MQEKAAGVTTEKKSDNSHFCLSRIVFFSPVGLTWSGFTVFSRDMQAGIIVLENSGVACDGCSVGTGC